jgi:hypothetical protein
MDPYLEESGLWRQVHTDLIVDLRRFLSSCLRPRYYVAIEQHTYLTPLPSPDNLVGIPDALVLAGPQQYAGMALAAPVTTAARLAPVTTATRIAPVVAVVPQLEEVKHRYLEIHKTDTRQVITIIEILSPANKLHQEGRQQYERKRQKILRSLTNLVEIDLLRAGQPMPMKVPHQADYRLLVSRSEHRPRADVYLFGLRQPIPDCPVPLQPDEEEPLLPLNQLLHDLYEQSSYDLMIDYRRPATPPLSAEDLEWAGSLVSPEPDTTSTDS